MDKYQQLRLTINQGDNNIRINSETDKNYKYVKGIFVSSPDYYLLNATLGLKIGQQELFGEDHEIKMLSCGNNVAPNDKFFQFDTKLPALGSVIEGRFKCSSPYVDYPMEIILYFWLTNHAS